MLTGSDNLILILATLAATCLLLLIVNHFWSAPLRRPHNDVIGWQLAVIGTIYAVMIGFMLFAVWGNFQAADINVDNEASALINLYQLADGLPEPQRDIIKKQSEAYAEAMVNEEWPSMNAGKLGTSGHPIIQKLWSTSNSVEAITPNQQISLSHTLDQISALSQDRHIRQMQSEASLPPILWAVLICGGAITVIAAGLIGSESPRLHFVLVLALSLMVTIVLVAIADIDGPFQGSVHIRSNAFSRVGETMAGR